MTAPTAGLPTALPAQTQPTAAVEAALEAAVLVEATPVDMQTMASVMTAPTAGLPTALPAQTQTTAAVEVAHAQLMTLAAMLSMGSAMT
jgi:hypothetical protein